MTLPARPTRQLIFSCEPPGSTIKIKFSKPSQLFLNALEIIIDEIIHFVARLNMMKNLEQKLDLALEHSGNNIFLQSGHVLFFHCSPPFVPKSNARMLKFDKDEVKIQ